MLTLRFRPGKDDELQEWYEALPKGERSRIVRRILKNYIQGKSVKRVEINKLEVHPKTKLKTNPVENIEQKINNLMNKF